MNLWFNTFTLATQQMYGNILRNIWYTPALKKSDSDKPNWLHQLSSEIKPDEFSSSIFGSKEKSLNLFTSSGTFLVGTEELYFEKCPKSEMVFNL